MRVSDKVDAEFINAAVFKLSDRLYSDLTLYKIGFLLLAKNNTGKLAQKIRYIDFIMYRIDSYLINNDMKKALVYTMLLNKRISKVIDELRVTDVNSLIPF